MYLDPFIIGIVLSIFGLVIGTKIKKCKPADIERYKKLHIRPQSECDTAEDKKTHRLTYVYIGFGIMIGLFFVIAYALPYMNAMK